MFLLGLLLLCATGAFTGLLIAYNTGGGPDYTVTMFGNTLGTLNSLEIFVAGIVLALLFCLSLAMILGGGVMRRRRRIARRAERREAAQARAERDEMAARLDADQPDMERIERERVSAETARGADERVVEERAVDERGATERGAFTPRSSSTSW